ncbi:MULTISPECIES: MmcQ/YjbR family DNA-binding protein [unclassified Fusibacter]|uniref:MmcQ/YjbR family DNA-binding protein n=1 Tax=unclassified Fusibacter TaxID=2624464 RepID=UPI0010108161|nr:MULTISPECIES: MmcQ/YjbR family DNA-binding protein [unclassified Fusibacter]MCK8058852.1 MmcQ/YjbR family DNA-binding protein [Fusibacter sp. A2]NPE21926.1 MmcQ/YjbR family DNA-binding protein [Fusibacter sp. A1]RXV61496.1 MmcQ/YjbR family DNA-binding protein [Fusibacter sp. A1]
MTLEQIKAYCLAKHGTTEEYPFDFDTLVFKVMNKMYALIIVRGAEININLKCDPELAIVLRHQYQNVTEGYHMNKKHWNTIVLPHEAMPDKEVKNLIDHSFDLVVSNLKKSERQYLESLIE